MSNVDLSMEGGASEELAKKAVDSWIEAAARGEIDLTDFQAEAPLADRFAWARGLGLGIGGGYSRFSTKMQDSTWTQVKSCVTFGGLNRIYVPPEMLCVDESVKGRRSRRKGLDRLKAILEAKHIDTLLVYKASRIYRKAHKSMAFLDEDVVGRDIRAVSVYQGIDTSNDQAWRLLFGIHALIDESYVDSLAVDVRNNLKTTFLNGYVTGALRVGYRPRIVPGARPTRRGHPRTEPEVDPEVASLIVQHYKWIADGIPLAEGWRRWVQAKGAYDPRSASEFMRPEAYRRMLSNTRYTGLWEFGRKRNRWNSKKDYTEQVVQPDDEVEVRRSEDLRIVSDELFFKVQKRLANETRGRHKKRREDKPVHLWDLVTDVYHCKKCGKRFYQRGAGGEWMACGDARCDVRGMLRRDRAVQAVCRTLSEIIQADGDLVEAVVKAAQDIDARDDQLVRERDALEKDVARIRKKINIVIEVAGADDDEAASTLEAELKSLKQKLNDKLLRLAEVKKAECRSKRIIAADDVKSELSDLAGLLKSAADGKLGDDMIYRASDVFRRLVGGRIDVCFEARPGRTRTVAKGVFTPKLLAVAKQHLDVGNGAGGRTEEEPVTVWLRKPPRVDRIAGEVRRLYEDEDLGFREIGDLLKCGSGNACLAYRRWYESRGLPVPPARRPGGRPRKER